MDKYRVIGLMSGTSQDGLDIAFCTISVKNNKWSYIINKAYTIKYNAKLKHKLSALETASASDLAAAHMEFGEYMGLQVNKFIKKYKIKPDFIASHGHTIFHRPDKGFTFQLGAGASIAATCNMQVVADFRSLDVALGGQGAPLVPIGDRLLFTDYDYCLNLGGFANVSYEKLNKRLAFDICPVNIVLNQYAEMLGMEYDAGGDLSRKGTVNEKLLNELNSLAFYKTKKGKPKSLGKEWVIEFVMPLFKKHAIAENDILRTFTEHIAWQIAAALNNKTSSKVLVTGGGAYNKFLLERIKAKSRCKFILPGDVLINYKEALIFALLGVLKVRNEINTLRSVTGASSDSSGGAVYSK